MDFPLFFLDGMGTRMMVALTAVTHVLINHPLAVGAYPLAVLLEWWGRRTKQPGFDTLAYKLTFVFFILTTTFGALTGVGIWLYTALVNPAAIGSLLRVFFWAWFAEWIVFITEVALVLVYFLMWKKWSEGAKKTKHIAFGVALALFSWFTMAIITAILGFMMDVGRWGDLYQGFFEAFLNPLYLPQLLFRTAYSMVGAGLFVWFLLFFFTKHDKDLRARAIRFVSRWTIAWVPPLIVGALWYRGRVPGYMMENMDVALLTQAWQQWYDTALWIILAMSIAIVLVVGIGSVKARLIPRVALLIPFLLAGWLLGHFERVREFARKPWVIADYMYANGIRSAEMPIFQRDGMLRYAVFAEHNEVTSSNMVEAGEEVFQLACSRCHTTVGMNGVVNKFENMYGKEGEWSDATMKAFVQTMHNSRTYMPPFPGSPKEADALIAWVQEVRHTRQPVYGVQIKGMPEPKEYQPQGVRARELIEQGKVELQ